MSEVVERLTADVKKLQEVAQKTADGLVAARTDIADLKTKLADLESDPAELVALADSVEETLKSIAAELPEPAV